MVKLALLLVGALTGATGTTAWLLSEPDLSPSASGAPARWNVLNARLRQAIADGQRTGVETEERLRRDLDAYRRGQRPASP